jgi:putative aldouronate transport system substrate-binding protein
MRGLFFMHLISKVCSMYLVFLLFFIIGDFDNGRIGKRECIPCGFPFYTRNYYEGGITMKKRLLNLTLALVTVSTMALSACGGNTANPTPSTQTEQNEATTEAAPEAAPETPAEPAGPITWDSPNLSWKQDTSPVTLSCYIDFDWYSVDTWGLDEVSQEITRITGISLDVTKGSDLNQLGVLYASGDLPDLIFTTNQIQRFWDPDICAPWDELIPQYAPEWMDLIDPVEIINNTTPDGHFYTLKSHYNNEENWNDPRNLPSPGDGGLYFRGDILEAIGNPEINSIEDVKEVFKTVKNRSEELGIDIVYNPHPTWQNAFEEFFGIVRPPYVDGDHVHIYRSNPNWRDFLLFMNEMYRDGYLYKEYLAARPEDFFQLNRSGRVFCATYNTQLATETNKIFDEQGIDGYFTPNVTALTYNGQDLFQPVDGGIGWANLFIAADCEHLDRAIRYMEFLKSPEGDALTLWGIPEKHYNLNEDGLLVRTEYYNSKTAAETGVGPWYFQASGLAEGVGIHSGIANPDPVLAGYAQYGVDLMKFRKEHYVRNPALYFARPDTDSDEFMIEIKIADEWTKRVADIISASSAAEAETLYEEMMAYLNTIGLEQLEADLTARYFEALKRYEQ